MFNGDVALVPGENTKLKSSEIDDGEGDARTVGNESAGRSILLHGEGCSEERIEDEMLRGGGGLFPASSVGRFSETIVAVGERGRLRGVARRRGGL